MSVGQAGNQIGHRLWELAVQEHAGHTSADLFPDAMSPLFRNVDASTGGDLPLSRGRGPLDRQPLPMVDLRARAVLVDMVSGGLCCAVLWRGLPSEQREEEKWKGGKVHTQTLTRLPPCCPATTYRTTPYLPQEEGVVNGVLRGPLGELFDSGQLLTDVSGSGNNWAHG